MTLRTVGHRLRLLVQDYYLTLGLLVLTGTTTWALSVNYSQTRRLDELVTEARQRELQTAFLDCQSRSIGRDGVRRLVGIITNERSTLPPERVALYLELLEELPPIVCPDPSERTSITP
jgi:hypothetical protein